MKNYINKYCHNIKQVYSFVKGYIVSWHEALLNQGFYKIIWFECIEVLVFGFLVSIALVSFGFPWKPWLSISYGLVPWLIVQFAIYFKREFKYKK